MEFFVSLAVLLGVLFPVIAFVTFRVLYAVLLRVTIRMFFLTVPRRRLRSQRFVMHFVGKGVGFLGRVLLIVFVVILLIGIQRFLQLFELGGLYKRLGHRFDRLRALFGIGLRFFVLGFGQLLGERGYIFLGKDRTIRSGRFH